MNVVVIGVNYGTDTMALRFVRSLAGTINHEEVAVVLVDNTDDNDRHEFFDKVLTVYPDTICVRPSLNLGYLGGASRGLESCLQIEHDYPAWTIVSNVDVEFRDDSFFDLLNQIEAADIGIITPAIWGSQLWRDPNRALKTKPSKARMMALAYLFKSYLLLNCYTLLAAAKNAVKYAIKYKLSGIGEDSGPSIPTSKSAKAESLDNRLDTVYGPHGSCIIFSKAYFLKGGSLAYPAFLFGEEIYLAETAANLGLRVVYAPRLRVWHRDHASTGLVRSRRLAAYMSESTQFIVDTFFR